MKVIFNGQEKDLHPVLANKLLKSGKAQLIDEVKEVKETKTRKRIAKDE